MREGELEIKDEVVVGEHLDPVGLRWGRHQLSNQL